MLSKCELNSYTLQHCSPQMLHFQGFASEWHPLWRKYSVWSGKPIPQKMHCKLDSDRFPIARHSDESEGCSGPVLVMAPFVVVAVSLGEVSGLGLGLAVDRPRGDDVIRDTILRLRSSRSRLFSGDTLISELRLLEVAVCICTLPEGEVLGLGPFRLDTSYSSSPGSCLIGINEIEGVMFVSWSIRRELAWMWLLDGAFELESADWGEPGQSPFIRWEASPL